MRVLLQSAMNTMETTGRQVGDLAKRLARVPLPGSTPVKDTVELKEAQTCMRLSSRVVKTASEVLGTIVDIIA